MTDTPEISICLASNRPSLWKNMHDNITATANGLSFEMIVVGPKEADFQLPSNLKYIKTGNIKVPQCCEISMQYACGKNMMIAADDCIFWGDKGFYNLYEAYNNFRNKIGNDNVAVVPSFKAPGAGRQKLRYDKNMEAPIASLNYSWFSKDLWDRLGGFDISFVAVYHSCDLAMRFQENGINILKSDDVVVKETSVPVGEIYLHRVCKPYDNAVLNSLWTRKTIEGEIVPSDSVWCFMRNRSYVVSKKRLKEIIKYKDEDILTKSQGPKEYGGLVWE